MGKMVLKTESVEYSSGSRLQPEYMSVFTEKVLTMNAGAMFLFKNGATIKCNKTVSLKSFEYDDGVFVLTGLDGIESRYDVSESFKYPLEAKSHLIGDISYNSSSEDDAF